MYTYVHAGDPSSSPGGGGGAGTGGKPSGPLAPPLPGSGGGGASSSSSFTASARAASVHAGDLSSPSSLLPGGGAAAKAPPPPWQREASGGRPGAAAEGDLPSPGSPGLGFSFQGVSSGGGGGGLFRPREDTVSLEVAAGMLMARAEAGGDGGGSEADKLKRALMLALLDKQVRVCGGGGNKCGGCGGRGAVGEHSNSAFRTRSTPPPPSPLPLSYIYTALPHMCVRAAHGRRGDFGAGRAARTGIRGAAGVGVCGGGVGGGKSSS